MANIADGVYNATITAAAVYEKNGLKLELHLALCDENGNGYTQTGTDGKQYPVEKRMYYTLISKDGAVNTKVIQNIKAWAKAWDGTDPFWFTEAANTDALGIVECTLATEPSYSDPSKVYQNVKYINELGHSSRRVGISPVQSGDKAAIMAKYGAKFKAAAQANPTPVSAASLAARKPAPTTAPAPSRPAPNAPNAVPAPSAPTPIYKAGIEGQAQVWDEYCAEHPNDAQDSLSTAWFTALDEVVPGKDQADLTSDEWKCVADKLGIMPF